MLAAEEVRSDGGYHYPAIGRAIDYLVEHYQEQPSLEDVAAVAGMSPFHFQRVFKRWAGISPKRFGQYLTLGHAKALLSAEESVLGTAYEVGLSGPGRLHDLFIACEAVTPGEYKARGEGLDIRWGAHDSPLGQALIGATERGVCWLGFVDGRRGPGLDELRGQWPLARLTEDPGVTRPIAEAVFAGERPPVPLLLRGTNFQIKVWEALLTIPPGTVVSYGDVAGAIGRPTAMRAVGHAVGSNPLSVIIPCHRVILRTGVVHNYRWGVHRKRALLALEAGRLQAAG